MELIHKELTGKIIGVAMEVHRELGCGFLEAIYQEAFEYELRSQTIPFSPQKPHRVAYKNIILRHPYIPDLIIDEKVVVDLKAIREIGSVEEAQMINYLKITGIEIGMILNFGNKSLDWKRLVFRAQPKAAFKDSNQRNPRFQNSQNAAL